MKKYLLMLLLTGLCQIKMVAQQDTLQIRPEVLKAIREGTFLNLNQPSEKLQRDNLSLPITKDFTEYIQPDEQSTPIDPKHLPPGVFMLQQIKQNESQLKVQADIFHSDKQPLKQPGNPNASIGFSFSFDEMLQLIFWQSARDKRRNKKRSNTWKYYNDYPTY